MNLWIWLFIHWPWTRRTNAQMIHINSLNPMVCWLNLPTVSQNRCPGICTTGVVIAPISRGESEAQFSAQIQTKRVCLWYKSTEVTRISPSGAERYSAPQLSKYKSREQKPDWKKRAWNWKTLFLHTIQSYFWSCGWTRMWRRHQKGLSTWPILPCGLSPWWKSVFPSFKGGP